MTELEAIDERQSRSGEADVNNSNSASEDGIDETTMTKKKKSVDLELFSCLLQPATASSDPIQITLAFDVPFSIGKRRTEMQWKRIRQLPKLHSQAKKLGEYADIKPAKHFSKHVPAFCKAIPTLSECDGFHLQVHFPICMRWSSGALAGIFTSHQPIEQATTQVSEMVITNGVEAFVGMHCNIYHCKAADGNLIVCTVSVPTLVLKQLTGHTEDVTVAESAGLDICFDDLTRPTLQYVTQVKARQEDVLHIFRTLVQPSSKDN